MYIKCADERLISSKHIPSAQKLWLMTSAAEARMMTCPYLSPNMRSRVSSRVSLKVGCGLKRGTLEAIVSHRTSTTLGPCSQGVLVESGFFPQWSLERLIRATLLSKNSLIKGIAAAEEIF